MSFHSLGLDAQLLRNIESQGYTLTTPIQKQTIPAILNGRDVVGLAQTGTGKTAAFVLPVLHRLLSGPRRRLRALIVGPTRELAEQTKDVLLKLGAGTGLRHVTIYGGVGMQPQINGVRQGAEIAIACPGRLLDLLGRNKFTLDHVECLVLDEADRMFDMGFLPDIRKILKRLPAAHQTLLFSATMPDEIRKLAHEILRDPVTVQIAHSKPAETVDHALYPVEQGQKTGLLVELLKTLGDGSVLVFTRTKQRAKRLAAQLAAAGRRAASLQGNLSQRQRQAALDGFKSGRHQILVATDLAARGIDVVDITHVINLDMPVTVDDYTHRIGRTGRAARTGDAFTFTTREDEGAVRAIERLLGFKIERRRLDGFDYSRAPAPLEAASHARAASRPHSQAPRTSARPAGTRHGGHLGGKAARGKRSFGSVKAKRRFTR
ncbi:MAG TPA: DEAD/DEAH box helicase [Kiritimatiellia bacterium]|nr:DEAD/DEAH box helicase [Kiritimatiellia bacterium]